MKRFLCILAMCWSGFASANLIQISTDAVDVNPNDVVSFQVELVDFEAFDFLTFAINFNDQLVQFDLSSLQDGSEIVIDDLSVDPFLPGELFFTVDSFFSGTVYQGTFTLATFDFIAISSGIAQFTGVFDLFLDDLALGPDISVNTPTFGVAPTAVSEPSVMAVLLIGLVFMCSRRREK